MQIQTHFRVDKKEQDTLVLANMGLTPNEAYRIFRRKTIESGGLPFEVSQPSTKLKKALKSKNYIKFDSVHLLSINRIWQRAVIISSAKA